MGLAMKLSEEQALTLLTAVIQTGKVAFQGPGNAAERSTGNAENDATYLLTLLKKLQDEAK